MLKIGSLWKSKEGAKSIGSGAVDKNLFPLILQPGARLVMLKNSSDHEKSPNWDIWLAHADDESDSSESPKRVSKEKQEQPFDDDDIPW